MKPKSPFFILLGIALSSYLSGCISAAQSPASTVTPNVTKIIIASTSTPTRTPTLTQTITLVPTLSQDDAYLRFKELLQGNEGCQLPCWWGITPGISSFQDAQAILVPLSSIANWNNMSVADGKGWFGITYPDKTNEILMDVDFSTLSNKSEVSMFHISSQVLRPTTNNSEPIYDDKVYLELMRNYTLSSILSAYGKPDQAGLVVEYIAETGLEYSMYLQLFYQEQGIFIKYHFNAPVIGDQISVCLSKSFIELGLVPPFSDISDWKSFFPELETKGMSLDEAFHMDIDTFYETLREPTNHCLETPLSLWPNQR